MSKKANWILTGVLAVIAVAFTACVKVIDVEPVGADGTEVGFAHLNLSVFQTLGISGKWYMLTEVLGFVALAIAASMALVGLIQMIRRRSLFKVDKSIISLGFLYAIVIVLYVGFDKIAINYRPIIMAGEIEPEPSFPSSHTMLACVVFATAMIVWAKALRKHPAFKVLIIIECIALIVLTVGGRLLSGAHWLTDIIGGVLYSAALISGYCAVNNNKTKEE